MFTELPFYTLQEAFTRFSMKMPTLIRETPSGLVNGANRRFKITHLPMDAMIMFFVGGLLQDQTQYTLSGRDILTSYTIKSTNNVEVVYWYVAFDVVTDPTVNEYLTRKKPIIEPPIDYRAKRSRYTLIAL